MVVTLFWAAVGLAGAFASSRTLAKIRADRAALAGPVREPDGRLARLLVPRLGIRPATWDRIAIARDAVRYWARQVAAVVAGGFCVLLVAGALLRLVTGG